MFNNKTFKGIFIKIIMGLRTIIATLQSHRQTDTTCNNWQDKWDDETFLKLSTKFQQNNKSLWPLLLLFDKDIFVLLLFSEGDKFYLCHRISTLFSWRIVFCYRGKALVNRKNLTNFVTSPIISVHKFLAMSLLAIRTLHTATITTVLKM